MDAFSDKKNIFVICGGGFSEWDISIRSARSLHGWICQKTYNVFFVIIDHDGQWRLLSAQMFQKTTDGGEVGCFIPDQDGGYWKGTSRIKVHVIFPMVHGCLGEDGALPGLCDALDMPYVGSGMLGSAMCWDKSVTKRILHSFDIPYVPFLSLKHWCNKAESMYTYNAVCQKFKTNDLFIKPAMDGSSVGVSMVSDEKTYIQAMKKTLSLYDKVMIEPRIEGDEIECAVLDNCGVKASALGQIVTPQGRFYTYKEKYSSTSMTKTLFPEHISSYLTKKIQDLAIQCFCALECKGMARVDFFVTNQKKIMVNEVNTIPGFTSISLYPKMWEKSGMRPERIVQVLIDEALKRWHSKRFYAQKGEKLCQE